MAGGAGDTIKLFRFIQKTYQAIGVFPPKSNQNRSPINFKDWFFIFCEVLFFISTAAHLFFEANNSMIEYGLIFFTCTTSIFCIVTYLILFWQMKNILNFIENCERFVEKSKYRLLFFIHYKI